MIEDYMVPLLQAEREAAEERMVQEQIAETEARLLREMADVEYPESGDMWSELQEMGRAVEEASIK